jgi:hypothetical protein
MAFNYASLSKGGVSHVSLKCQDSGVETAILPSLLTLIIAWFCAIINFIPFRLHLDQKAIIAEKHTGDPNLSSKQDQ